ncbi:hypothetical protein [Azotobacter salinestris]|uniref:hypothetical protein n=1 Tax=Azotobacter salinestris TaxID=69964 RepID=UPI0032DF016A
MQDKHQQVAKRIAARDPRVALAWIRSGHPVRIASMNFKDWQRHIEALAKLDNTQREAIAA